MFDVGFSELAVIGVVALIVIGPEELPRVARTAGHLMGRLRRYVADVKSDISREMDMADLARVKQDVEDSARELKSSLTEQTRELENEFHRSIAPESVVEQVSHQQLAPAHQLPPAVESDMQIARPTEHPHAIGETGEQVAERDENQLDLFGGAAPRSDRS